MSSKFKRITALLICLVTSISLVGCNKDENENPMMDLSKEDLVAYIESLESDVADLEERNEELEVLMAGIQGEEIVVPAISEFSDGTGRTTLNTVDSRITLPTEFTYPHSVQTLSSSCVQISDKITINPNANWVVSVNGTTVDIEHVSSQISGQFVIGELDVPHGEEAVRADGLTDVLSKFFESMPPENIKYTRIYVKDKWVGMDTYSHTFIDEKDAYLRCGMLAQGDTTLCYMFVYKGSQDVSKDELILNILKGMKINGNNLVIE